MVFRCRLWSYGRCCAALLAWLLGLVALPAIGPELPSTDDQVVAPAPAVNEELPAQRLVVLIAHRPQAPPAGLEAAAASSFSQPVVVIVATYDYDGTRVRIRGYVGTSDPVNRWDPSGLYWQYVKDTGWQWIEADNPGDAGAFYDAGLEIVNVGIHGRSGSFQTGLAPLGEDGMRMGGAAWDNHVISNVHWGSYARPGYVALPSNLSGAEKNAAMSSLPGAIGSGIAARAAQARAANEAIYAQAMAEFERRKAEALANGRDLVDLGGGFAFDLTAARDPNHWNEASKSVLFYMMTGEGRGVVVGGEPLSWSDVGIEGLKEAAITVGTAGTGKLISVGGRVIFRAAAHHGDEVVDVGRHVVRHLDEGADATQTIVRTSSGLPQILPATVVRELRHGEKVADIITEAGRLTHQSGLEHAVVRLKDGRRVLVSGGETGIQFGDDVERIIGHTHPSHRPSFGPSIGPDADTGALDKLENTSGYLLERGELYKFWNDGDAIVVPRP